MLVESFVSKKTTCRLNCLWAKFCLMSFIPICDKPAILNKLEGLKLVLNSLCYILQDTDTFLQYYLTSNPITTDNQ